MRVLRRRYIGAPRCGRQGTVVDVGAPLVVHRRSGHVLVDAEYVVAELVGNALYIGQRRLETSHQVGGGKQHVADLEIRPWRQWRLDDTAQEMPDASQVVKLLG